MEYLSEQQIRNYEEIIKQIQAEHETYQKLSEENAKLNNELIFSILANSKSSLKLGHVKVKVFSDILELFALYQDELKFDNLSVYSKLESKKFYLLEIYITQSLWEKLKGLNWSLWVYVQYHDGTTVNKSVKMTDCETPTLCVIPVDNSVINSTVVANMQLISNETLLVVCLDRVEVDVSYHFESVKRNNNHKKVNKNKQIIAISKSYNPNNVHLDSVSKPLIAEYKFVTKMTNQDILKLFIKNCYHNVDIELMSEFSSNSKDNLVIKFACGFSKYSLSLNKTQRVITLKGDCTNLSKLKSHFCNQTTVDAKEMVKRQKVLKVRE